MIKLGSRVVDPISGFSGIVVARFEWLHGCVRVSVEAEELKDGKVVEQTFDEARVEVIDEEVVTPSKRPQRAAKGGDRPGPSRPSPSR